MAFALPGFSASLYPWLAPPYLFVAVNLIDLVLWKLADEKQQHNHSHLHQQWESEERMAESRNPAKVLSFEPSRSADLIRKPSPGIWPDEISPSSLRETVVWSDSGDRSTPDSSCLTAESGESSTASTAFTESNSSSTEPEEEKSMAATAAVMGNASMDLKATWKSITEKLSRPALAPLPADAASTKREERTSEGHELNQRIRIAVGARNFIFLAL